MAVMNSGSNSLLAQLRKDYPEITFRSGDCFLWSPRDKTVQYLETNEALITSQWSLLHEVSHYTLGHTTYQSDFELLKLELAAWQQAKHLSGNYDLKIDQDHIEDCLDTYRDWLHKRSLCPTCGVNGIQTSKTTYTCPNCPATWQVSVERFCRAYRRKIT